MAYLEERHFMHRDLALRNVLISADERRVKICDFGLTRFLPDREQHYVMSGAKKVPFAWCAPESLKFKQFSHASDVWMYGVVLWEIWTLGEEPWVGVGGAEILQRELNGERLPRPFPRCPIKAYHLMLDCWSIETERRPTFRELQEKVQRMDFERGQSKTFQRIADDPSCSDLLELDPGDVVYVIDGTADSFYWTGQSERTRKCGRFARKVLTMVGTGVAADQHRPSVSTIASERDISRPLRGSFVHTGHGDGRGGESWGYVDRIDPLILRNALPFPLLDQQTAPAGGLSFRSSFDTSTPARPGSATRTSTSAQGYCPQEPQATSTGIYYLPPPAVDEQKRRSNRGSTSGAERRPASIAAPASTSSSPGVATASLDDLLAASVSSMADRFYDMPPPSAAAVTPKPEQVTEPIRSVPATVQPMSGELQGKQPMGDYAAASRKQATPGGDVMLAPPTSSVQQNPRWNTVPAGRLVYQPSMLPPAAASTSSAVVLRTEPDPFEVSLDVKQLAQRTRYSELYSGQPAASYQPPGPRLIYVVTAASPKQKTPPPVGRPSASVAPFSFVPPPPAATQSFRPRPVIGSIPAPGGTIDYATRWPAATSSTKLNSSLPFTMTGTSQFSALPIHRASVPQPAPMVPMDNALLSLFDPLANKLPDDLVREVQGAAPYATVERASRALRRNGMNVVRAVEELKVEKLVDLGLGAAASIEATKARVRAALEQCRWDMDTAASILLG